MHSPALAIAWELWHRARLASVALLAALAGATCMAWAVGPTSPWTHLLERAGYIVLALTVLLVFSCFHFTEGQKKGGFGSFPLRLFTMPVATRWLVGLPMLYGSAGVVLVYVSGAWLIFAPLGVALPILWPCLYLVFALSQFQMIIWSFPQSRYLKLLCLSFSAALITFGWMFFLPHMIDGTLGEWGYTGSTQVFLRFLFVALAMAGPAAYGLSVYRVHQQRHGTTRHPALLTRGWESLSRSLLFRRKPFRSATHALFWSEWRRTGFILPIATGAILALTCILAWLSGPLSSEATIGMLIWLLLAPFLLAVVIGRGTAKPDFWEQTLSFRPLDAIRPVSSGQWVATKLKVAWWSVSLTWLLVLLSSFLLVAHAGNLAGLDQWHRHLKMFYTLEERSLMLALALPAMLVLTWRCLVSGLAVGLSGRAGWYVLSNILTAVLWISILFLIIWRSDRTDHPLHLYDLWGWITWLPAFLGAAIVLKMLLAFCTWHQVCRRELLASKSILACFARWALATGCLMALVWVAVPHTDWLRSILLLLALGTVPLAGPGLAILSLARNRHDPGAPEGWRVFLP